MDERYNALAEVHGNIAATNKRLVSENAVLQEVGAFSTEDASLRSSTVLTHHPALYGHRSWGKQKPAFTSSRVLLLKRMQQWSAAQWKYAVLMRACSLLLVADTLYAYTCS